jgi:hypothetical protein
MYIDKHNSRVEKNIYPDTPMLPNLSDDDEIRNMGNWARRVFLEWWWLENGS